MSGIFSPAFSPLSVIGAEAPVWVPRPCLSRVIPFVWLLRCRRALRVWERLSECARVTGPRGRVSGSALGVGIGAAAFVSCSITREHLRFRKTRTGDAPLQGLVRLDFVRPPGERVRSNVDAGGEPGCPPGGRTAEADSRRAPPPPRCVFVRKCVSRERSVVWHCRF